MQVICIGRTGIKSLTAFEAASAIVSSRMGEYNGFKIALLGFEVPSHLFL